MGTSQQLGEDNRDGGGKLRCVRGEKVLEVSLNITEDTGTIYKEDKKELSHSVTSIDTGQSSLRSHTILRKVKERTGAISALIA